MRMNECLGKMKEETKLLDKGYCYYQMAAMFSSKFRVFAMWWLMSSAHNDKLSKTSQDPVADFLFLSYPMPNIKY